MNISSKIKIILTPTPQTTTSSETPEPPTLDELPTDTSIAEFTLTENKIYFNGEYTNYNLQPVENGYLIFSFQTTAPKRVGSIIDGEISFTVQDSEIQKIKNLKTTSLKMESLLESRRI